MPPRVHFSHCQPYDKTRPKPWRAECSCGWHGKRRRTKEQAMLDRHRHDRVVEHRGRRRWERV